MAFIKAPYRSKVSPGVKIQPFYKPDKIRCICLVARTVYQIFREVERFEKFRRTVEASRKWNT